MSTNPSESLQTLMAHTATLREKLSSDPQRPGYHFATPGDYGIPGDPNGAFYANGRYHLMYLYQSRMDGFRYGHLSSTDLVHWHFHPDAVRPDALDGGIFSGGAFLDEDGTAYLTYWSLPTPGAEPPQCNGGIRIAYSKDVANHYEKWEKFPDYAIPATEFGVLRVPLKDGGEDWLGCADPSNLWREGDTYYLQTGCLVAMNHFRDLPDAPVRMKGDWTDLFASRDLIHWEHRGRFYERDIGNHWTKEGEDDMCPSFLPLPTRPDGGTPSGKYLQLFLAHNRGAQYYIGTYYPERASDPAHVLPPFVPEQHGRMSWQDIACFAPEALVDHLGRQLAWFWLRDDRYCDEREMEENGWAGVFTLPRTLWLREDGTLGMDVAPEVLSLQYGETQELSRVDPRSCHIRLTRPSGTAGIKDDAIGFRVFATEQEYVDLYVDRITNRLVWDASHTVPGRDTGTFEVAPFTLGEEEELVLDLFVDRNVLEIFVNQRQAISRRIYWNGSPAPKVELLPTCRDDSTLRLTAWSMMESNPF